MYEKIEIVTFFKAVLFEKKKKFCVTHQRNVQPSSKIFCQFNQNIYNFFSGEFLK